MITLAFWKEDGVEYHLYKDERTNSVAMSINGGLQFDSRYEYRYHQSLFLLPALCLDTTKENNVLVLGGGDGLGARELLRLKHITSIDLVDISHFMITLAKHHPDMLELNLGSLHNPRVNVIIEDGIKYVEETDKKYDLIILDYPDPSFSNKKDQVNRLFTRKHYQDIKRLLKPNAIVAMQSTSVLISPNVFRYIQLLLKNLYSNILPMRIFMPIYGDIGIIIASDNEITFYEENIPQGVFFTKESLASFLLMHQDEMPTVGDDELMKYDIADLVKYDLFARLEDIKEDIKDIYSRQIEQATK
ncbi:MAG: hypothetical protein ACP5MB_05005 [bacterium]